ncbi:PAS domain S-box protein [Mycolicibacterium sp. ELW1]|uniref:PAS domain S-box protein n=1 Tax=Mycobacteriaceae TaxID=1762 RepID=UPI0011EF4094|nr:PAS domain S-box protein [Mycobacterium sp. ELW1]QEN13453.1 PAS domain S-box protein [Mycobacterium sp. ELW1]
MVLNDFCYDTEDLLDTRRYDIRATRTTPASITVTWRDVTERFRIAQHAAESEARYRRCIDNAAVGMCLVSPEGRLSEVNDAMAQFFGYDTEAMNGTSWQDFTGQEYLEAELNDFNAILQGRIDSYRMVKQYVRADGHPIWGDLSVSCIRGEDGHVENFVALISDITARVQADERNRILAQQLQQEKGQLAASERNYRLLVENTADVIIHARDGRAVWVSPAVKGVLGASPEYWVGRELREVIPPEGQASHAERMKALAEGPCGPTARRDDCGRWH